MLPPQQPNHGGSQASCTQPLYSSATTHADVPDASAVVEEGVGLPDLPHVGQVPDVQAVVVVDNSQLRENTYNKSCSCRLEEIDPYHYDVMGGGE